MMASGERPIGGEGVSSPRPRPQSSIPCMRATILPTSTPCMDATELLPRRPPPSVALNHPLLSSSLSIPSGGIGGVGAQVCDRFTGATYIVAKSRVAYLPSKKPKADKQVDSMREMKISNTKNKGGPQSKEKGAPQSKDKGTSDDGYYLQLEEIPGSSLVGLKYVPLFDYFLEYSETAFRVIADNYVTDDSGTGVVHCAPAFGEDDYRVCIASDIIKKNEDLIVAVDGDGFFSSKISDFQGHVKDADENILKAVKRKGRLVSSGSITHSYPFCWRSDTPLLYRAVPS